MLKSLGVNAICTVIFVTAYSLAVSQQASAQQVTPVLVVVANPSDAACTKRIGNKYVQVKLLFAPHASTRPNHYQACSERALELTNFQLLVFRSDCPGEVFWCNRMRAANPRGKSHRLSRSRSDKLTPREREMHRACEIHSALASILPGSHPYLDANLKAELHRLRSRSVHLHQLVASE